jgi:hypothetical protein
MTDPRSIPRAYTDGERAVNDRLDQHMADALAGKKPKPWQAPRTKLGDYLSRTISGVDLDAGTVDASVNDEAWNRLGADGREIDPNDPDTVAQYGEIVKEVENERELVAYNAMSHRQQLEARGVDQETIRSVYGNPS